MKQEVIDKLPPDAKKQFLKYAIKLSEKKTKSKVNDDFLTFVKHVWPEFIEGKHHKKIADKFNKLAKSCMISSWGSENRWEIRSHFKK